MEMTHLSSNDWTTVDLKTYHVQVNGGRELSGEDAAKGGTYNWIMENTDKKLYDAQSHTFESSHQLFRGVFVGGFPRELLEVFSSPPKVGFTWRHWGTFNGVFQDRKGTDEVMEMHGFTVATVNNDLKITKLEIYVKPNGFLEALQGKLDPSKLSKGTDLLGLCCPIYNRKE